MSSKNRIPGAALLLLLAVLPISLFAGIAVGDTPPDYLGKSEDKEKIHISDFRGMVVIVNFWAT